MSETTLHALLLEDRSKRPALLSDCERLIDSEVKAKGGISGVAIKGAYKVVSKMKPGMIREALDSLVEPFVDTLEPLFKEHLEAGGEPKQFDAFLGRNADRAADALLGVTDGKAQRAKNRTLKSAYDKLRPQAKKHVVQAVPGAGRVFVKHI